MTTKKKIEKRFYVGANKVFDVNTWGPNIGHTWAKATLEEAVEHAKKILKDTPGQEFAFVVQVIRVVRRKDNPIIVEKV